MEELTPQPGQPEEHITDEEIQRLLKAGRVVAQAKINVKAVNYVTDPNSFYLQERQEAPLQAGTDSVTEIAAADYQDYLTRMEKR